MAMICDFETRMSGCSASLELCLILENCLQCLYRTVNGLVAHFETGPECPSSDASHPSGERSSKDRHRLVALCYSLVICAYTKSVFTSFLCASSFVRKLLFCRVNTTRGLRESRLRALNTTSCLPVSVLAVAIPVYLHYD